MRQFSKLLFAISVLILSGTPIKTGAQGTAADYQRAAEISRRFHEAYHSALPKVEWRKNNLLLKTKSGEETVYRLYDGTTGEVKETTDAAEFGNRETQILKPKRTWGPSESGGESVQLTVHNKLKRTIRVFWSRPNGSLKAHGSVEPGEKRAISTFDGHQWIFDFKANDLTGIFVAGSSSCLAIVDKTSQQVAMEKAETEPSDDSEPARQRLSIRQHNVWITVDGEKAKQLTEDGTEEDPYAGRFHYSPDGRYAIGFRQSKVETRRIPLIDSTPDDQVQPKIKWINYPKPGDDISQRRPQLFDLKKSTPHQG